MALIRSFRDLHVYQLARKSSYKIYEITRSFPAEERYSIVTQIRRSSRAVNAMLAEAWALRYYVAAFTNKVDEALGEAMETQAWLDHAFDCNYMNREQFIQLDPSWQHIGGMLRRMIERSGDFCKTTRK